MTLPRKITFVLDEFATRSPGQQLLDRFLIGYARDGEFHRLPGREVSLAAPDDQTAASMQSRVKDFGLKIDPDLAGAVQASQAVVIVPRQPTAPNAGLHEKILGMMPPGSRCFIYGTAAGSYSAARYVTTLGDARSISLSSGTATATAFRLPEIALPPGARLRRSLMVVQGLPLEAELEALEGLFPFWEQRRGGEVGIRTAHVIRGKELWAAAYSREWSDLLSSAISRSNTIQGDPVLDGRTQDVFGSRRLETLAPNARAWIIEHHDGLISAIFVLDGALADFNCALQLRDRTILSAQLYRPPAPAQDHFSGLAAVIEAFFQSGEPPWQADKPLHVAAALETFAGALAP